MSANYVESGLLFKLRKVARYVRLYGLSRTWIKVRGQYHMRRTETFADDVWRNPACKTPDDAERTVGLIGCGNFAYSAIAYYLARENKRVLRAAFDAEPARSRSLCSDYAGAYAARDAQTVIKDPAIRIVFIASNHASHAEYAVECLDAGKDVHIEKPHVVSRDQLDKLREALARNPGRKLFLGFNRPRSEHFRGALQAMADQDGPTMINWFIAGHEIDDDHWYFDEREGGRVLGNLCHWTDLTFQLAGGMPSLPCDVVPIAHTGAKSDFAVGIKFADGSVAGITFSAKGHTFEGVREILHLHKGDLLLTIRDFGETESEVVATRRRRRSWHRDHGHGANIVNSYRGSVSGEGEPVTPEYAAATANLFLAVKESIDQQRTFRVTVEDYAPV